MNANKPLDTIPEDFASIEEAVDFWDSHSLADFWDQTEEAHFDVNLQRSVMLIPLEQSLARRLADVARHQGLSSETLANLWISERLQQSATS